MTLQGSQRRGFRRRMLQACGTAGSDSGPALPQPRFDRSTPYSKEARPENHRAFATLLPVRTFHLSAACVGLLLPVAVFIAAAATIDRWLPAPAAAGRWGRAIECVRECLTVSPRAGLAAWLGQVSLVAAACIAVSIRQMRRHRLDDYRGRYRAWGWIAGLAALATVERQLPLSELISATIADGSGIAFGPHAVGWWIVLAAPTCLAVCLWAVLPMHERLATTLAIFTTGLAWSAAAACGWIGQGAPGSPLAASSGLLTLAGDGLLAVSMLIAARSVLREVRGEAVKPARPSKPAARPAAEVEPTEETTNAQPDRPRTDTTLVATQWSDGSDDGDIDEQDADAWDENPSRKLSKAERKRLRKLGRMNRAA